MPYRLIAIIAMIATVLVAPAHPRAEPPRVVTDILPVHGLAARVMQGVGGPGLLLKPGMSPHHYAMRPSDARRLARANVVLWVGPELTPWLARSVKRLAPAARSVPLLSVPGTRRLAFRKGALFGGDDHGHGHGHGHGEGTDPHAWLNPTNARIWTLAIAKALASADPTNAALYRRNAARAVADIDAMAKRLRARLAPLAGRPWLVQHDAFRYFEDAFALSASGAIAASDESRPGAARIARLRALVRRHPGICIFTEPGPPPGILRAVKGSIRVRTGVLDILGSQVTQGPQHYIGLMEGLAAALQDCLGK